MNNAPSLAVWILAFNEEKNLASCLESIAPLQAKMVIVDSGSTDATLAIAAKHGVQVFLHAFESHSKQWNWALENLPRENEWVLALDADHRLTPELAQEILSVLRQNPSYDGFYLNRRQIFRSKWIRHGGYYPKYMMKLFRRSSATCDENELLDFRFYISGPTQCLKHDLVEDNRNESDLDFWISKHQRFARIQAREEWMRRTRPVKWKAAPRLFGAPDERVLWLKQRWYACPLFIRPLFYFVYRYFLRLGFLDGKQGFVFHFLQGFWYRLMVDIHLNDLKKRRAS